MTDAWSIPYEMDALARLINRTRSISAWSRAPKSIISAYRNLLIAANELLPLALSEETLDWETDARFLVSARRRASYADHAMTEAFVTSFKH